MAHARTAFTLSAMLALSTGLIGCAHTHQFSGMLRYGNLMSADAATSATEAAKQQIIEMAESYGLETRYNGESKLHFVAQAPSYSVTQPDGAIEERFDTRTVHVEVHLSDRAGRHTYRYYCRVEGVEPTSFSDEDRSRFGLALLAVREIFERPIETDFLGG